MGDCLRDDYGFQHVDIEDLESAQTRAFSMNASNFIQAATGDLVVTWGFRPLQDLVSVIQLREHLGFFPVWFDGDRAAALRHFNLRPTGLPESEFHMQIHNITVKDVVNTLKAPQIDPFEADGEFRAKESIAIELLGLCDGQWGDRGLP
jgi:hypothetical protein